MARRARLTIDPSLLQMVGKTLYSMNPGIIIPRELLQNSIDACRRAHVIPEITLSLETIYNSGVNPETVIICEDNGCGMDEDELVDKFLCLGGSSKRGEDSKNQSGRFGVAKAAIMSGYDWLVETNNLSVCLDDLTKDNFIQEVRKPRIGTKITVNLHKYIYASYEDAMKRMIMSSDVDIHLIISDDGVIENYEHAGLHQESEPSEDARGWRGSLVSPLDGKQHGYAFCRLNGLTQFEVGGYCSARETNLIIDINNPGDIKCDAPEYPFTLSRERLKDDLQEPVEAWVKLKNNNPITTDVLYQRAKNPEATDIIPGYLLKGVREAFKTVRETQESVQDSLTVDQQIANLQNLILLNNRVDATPFIDPSGHSPIMKMVDYDVTDHNIDRDSRIITAWGILLEIVVQKDIRFGVGLLGSKRMVSSVGNDSNVYFFSINPDYTCRQDTPKGRALSLWTTACHESAHLYQGPHDENFTLLEGNIQDQSADDFFAVLKKVSLYLSGDGFLGGQDD